MDETLQKYRRKAALGDPEAEAKFIQLRRRSLSTHTIDDASFLLEQDDIDIPAHLLDKLQAALTRYRALDTPGYQKVIQLRDLGFRDRAVKRGRYRVFHKNINVLDCGLHLECYEYVREHAGEPVAQQALLGMAVDGWRIESRTIKNDEEIDAIEFLVDEIVDEFPCVLDYCPRVDAMLAEHGWTNEDYYDAFQHPQPWVDPEDD